MTKIALDEIHLPLKFNEGENDQEMCGEMIFLMIRYYTLTCFLYEISDLLLCVCSFCFLCRLQHSYI